MVRQTKTMCTLQQTCCDSTVHIFTLSILLSPLPASQLLIISPLTVISQSAPVQELRESCAPSIPWACVLQPSCDLRDSGPGWLSSPARPPPPPPSPCSFTGPFSFCRCTPSDGSRLCLSWVGKGGKKTGIRPERLIRNICWIVQRVCDGSCWATSGNKSRLIYREIFGLFFVESTKLRKSGLLLEVLVGKLSSGAVY